METWAWAESSGTAVDEEPRVRSSQFGDGYSQDAPDGINSLVQQWALQFNNVADAAGNEMIAFLRARKGVERFLWTPLWETVPIIVKAPRWRRSRDGYDSSTISVTFVQAFEP